MAAVNSDLSVMSQDWVQKFQFENKMDSALQVVSSENDSMKIEIDHYSSHFASRLGQDATSDSYLQSILSSSKSDKKASTECSGDDTCSCYKCQRQKRRAGTNRTTAANNNFYTPLKNITDDTPPKKTYVASKEASNVKQSADDKSPHVANDNSSPGEQRNPRTKRTSTIRKTPTIKSYEKHMPNPVYNHQDSIYRVEKADQQKNGRENGNHGQPLSEVVQDNYQISWKDEGTGDDLLTSLVTFQSIFEEKGNTNQGLYDLLEKRTKEIKDKNLMAIQEAHKPKKTEELPPRLKDCLTISYRHGPPHNPLTLYHTMKMPASKDRLKAYDLAFRHCIHSETGMKNWMKRPRAQPTRENSKLVQPIRRPTIKRTLLHPLSSKKKTAANDTSNAPSTLSDNQSAVKAGRSLTPSIRSKGSVEFTSSPVSFGQEEVLTDVISVAHALLPNQQFSANTTSAPINENKVPYGHIDMPNRPNQLGSAPSVENLKDSCSVSSSESANGSTSLKLKSAPGRLLTSLGRKTSLRTYKFRSSEKTAKQPENTEKILDDLHRILPHIDRAQLTPYVKQANYDYMTALQLCKAAVISGELC